MILLVFGSGCYTTAYTREIGAKPVDLSSYSAIRIEASSRVPDRRREIQMIESKLAARLTDRRLFERVLMASRSADRAPLELKATITDLRRVSASLRLMWGALVGDARVAVEVTLIDAEASEPIAQFLVGSRSGGGTFGRTTDDSIDATVDEIVEYVVQGREHP